MQWKIMTAGASLVAAGIVGVASAEPVSAGCGVTIEVHNISGDDATIDWQDSDVRSRTWGVAGPWRELASYSTFVADGASVQRAFVMDLSCNNDRQYRLQVEQNGNTWFEYFPSQTAWTRDITPHVHIN